MDIRSVGEYAQGAALQVARPVQPETPATASVTASAASTSAADPAASAPPTHAQLGKAVHDLNKAMEKVAPGIEFTVDPDLNTTVVKLVDQHTKEVLRQIPSEETLEIAKALDKLQGLFISSKA